MQILTDFVVFKENCNLKKMNLKDEEYQPEYYCFEQQPIISNWRDHEFLNIHSSYSPLKPPPPMKMPFLNNDNNDYSTTKQKKRKKKKIRLDMSIFNGHNLKKWSMVDFKKFVKNLKEEEQQHYSDAIREVERKIKNRESAKQSRDRKNNLINSLQEENDQLIEENEQLREKNEQVREENEQLRKENERLKFIILNKD